MAPHRSDHAVAKAGSGARLEELLEKRLWREAEALARRDLALGARDPETHASAVIAMARAAMGRGDTAEMRLWLDRAGRIVTKDERFDEFRASLLLAAGDADGALAVLEDRATAGRGPSLARDTAVALALWQKGRQAEAVSLVEDLLFRQPLTPDCPLSGLAGMIAMAAGRAGWVGHRGGGLLQGALRPDLPGSAKVLLRAVSPDAPPLVAMTVSQFVGQHGDGAENGGRAFILALDETVSGPLFFKIGDQPLLGSGLPLSQSLPVEGIAEIEGSVVQGWASCPDLPDFPLEVRLADSGGRSVRPPVSLIGDQGNRRWRFSFDLAGKGLAPGAILVTAGPSDLPLAGSPLGWEAGAAKPRRPVLPPALRPMVDVVVPVHGGCEEALACLDSLRTTLQGAKAEMVVVDDATPDRALAAELDRLAEAGAITLLRNPTNRGFPAAVNRGMALRPDRDVVLLNSDTLVFGDWLSRLQAAAYASADTGTITPLSNNATICTYPTPEPPRPGMEEPAPPPAALCAALDHAAREVNRGCRVELPTAVGFCMYVRRDCLAESGYFSEDLFGRGYGEENDFCMRARGLGWRHYAAADVYVAHVGGHSFGRERLLLQERNSRVLERLHPGYHALVARFRAADPLAEMRRRIDLTRWWRDDPRQATLIVTHDLIGGVTVHLDERIRRLTEGGRRVLTLAPAESRQEPGAGPEQPETRRCRLTDAEQPAFRDLVFDTVGEREELVALLRRARVTMVEIHHCLNHDPSVLTLAGRLGVPYDVVVHDYQWICPQVTLIGVGASYCGEPGLDACERCALTLGAEDGAEITVAALRRRSGEVLRAARRVVVPCRDVAARLSRHIRGLIPVVEPWEPEISPPPPPRPAGGRLKVCVIGAIGTHKGYDVLLACARDAAIRDLPLEFVVAGYSVDDGPLFATGRVFVTGRYAEDEAEELVCAQQAHLAFLPSVCPETWCYSLSLAWRCGLWVAAFDLGAQAERIGASGAGWLLPLGMGARETNDLLLAIGRRAVLDESARQFPSGISPAGTHFLGCVKENRYMASLSPSVPAQISATVQAVTLRAGFYAVTVRQGGQPAVPGRLSLPAIQLVVPPDGVSSGAVEILSSHPGAWLTRVGDTVLLKVTEEASVLMTSYKNALAGGGSLDVEVQRIDAVGPASEAGISTANIQGAFVSPKVNVLAHIQMEGDQTFSGGGWAGARGANRWMEAIGVMPVEGLTAGDIEYKAVNGGGVETSWTSGGTLCGSWGQGMPLVGFAVRLRGAAAERFDCVYEGEFVGGSRSGPCRNGMICRSDVLGAPLEALLLSFVPKG